MIKYTHFCILHKINVRAYRETMLQERAWSMHHRKFGTKMQSLSGKLMQYVYQLSIHWRVCVCESITNTHLRICNVATFAHMCELRAAMTMITLIVHCLIPNEPLNDRFFRNFRLYFTTGTL